MKFGLVDRSIIKGKCFAREFPLGIENMLVRHLSSVHISSGEQDDPLTG